VAVTFAMASGSPNLNCAKLRARFLTLLGMTYKHEQQGKDLQENNMLKPQHIMALGGVSALLFAFAPAAMAVDVTGQVNGGTLSQTVGAPNLGSSSASPWVTTLVSTGNASATYVQPISIGADQGTGQNWTDTVTSTNYVGSTGAALAASFSFGASGDSSIPTATDETSTLSNVTLTAQALSDSFVGTAGAQGLGVIPQAATAPTATSFLGADTGTGMGNFTTSPTVTVVVPADAYTGQYVSTVTYTLQNGPQV